MATTSSSSFASRSLQLTGRRFLDGFGSDTEQYAALLNAGVTFARQYQLTPGVALTAEQMAQLTSDIVWLVEQEVTLPDGSTQRVLVPQVYVRVRPGDIDGSGALLAGQQRGHPPVGRPDQRQRHRGGPPGRGAERGQHRQPGRAHHRPAASMPRPGQT